MPSTSFVKLASLYVLPMRVLPAATIYMVERIAKFHTNVPSASGLSVGIMYVRARTCSIGASRLLRCIAGSLIPVTGQHRAKHLLCSIDNDVALIRIALHQRGRKCFGLLQRDMWRQRRYIRVGLHFDHTWAV
jgi:hypothetical protein